MSTDPSPPPTRDLGFYVVVSMVVVMAVWLLLIPMVSSVAMANMKRFHLRNDSFAIWAMHFPLPSMYNFANTYDVTDVAPGMIDPIVDLEPKTPRYINHFPLRLLTFGDARHSYLRSGGHLWVAVTSSYRGQSLTTTVHANRVDESSKQLDYEFKRLRGAAGSP